MSHSTPSSQLTLINSRSNSTSISPIHSATTTTTDKTTNQNQNQNQNTTALLTPQPLLTEPPNPINEINPQIPLISKSFTGPPSLGPILHTGQRRALLGWTHRNDSPEGVMRGMLWCWVGKGGGFQIYDAPVNRSPFPVGTGSGPNAKGDLTIDCGVANFGMVRMFHPWWCPYSRVPKDMNQADKLMCRHRYRQLITRHERIARNKAARNRNRNRNRNRQQIDVDESDSDDELLFFNRRDPRNSGEPAQVQGPRGRRIGDEFGYVNVGNARRTKKKPLIIELDDDDDDTEIRPDADTDADAVRGRNAGNERKDIEKQGRDRERGSEEDSGGYSRDDGEAGPGPGAEADFEILIKETQEAERRGTADTARSRSESDLFFIA